MLSRLEYETDIMTKRYIYKHNTYYYYSNDSHFSHIISPHNCSSIPSFIRSFCIDLQYHDCNFSTMNYILLSFHNI